MITSYGTIIYAADSFLNDEMQALQHRWRSCIDHIEDYAKKMNLIWSLFMRVPWVAL